MPANDVSDLRDVVEAINQLCDTMKTSHTTTDDELDVDSDTCSATGDTPESRFEVVDPVDSCFKKVYIPKPEIEKVNAASDETILTEGESECCLEMIDALETCFNSFKTSTPEIVEESKTCFEAIDKPESYTAVVTALEKCIKTLQPEARVDSAESVERNDWPESCFKKVNIIKACPDRSETCPDVMETAPASPEEASRRAEPLSDMYYTASSEVSLLSDTELPDREEQEMPDVRAGCPLAGHVAAMRERFESMTRANTPCPDQLLRSISPSHDVFSNITPSPDFLG